MEKKEEQKEILLENENISKWLLWLVDHRKQFFSILAIMVFSGVIIYKTIQLYGLKGNEGAVVAENIYQGWKTSPQDNKSFSDLKKFLHKYPDIRPKYEGLMVQQLLINENLSEEAVFMANKALKRTDKELPYYSSYSYTTLLILQKKYENALLEAKKLKNEIASDLSFLKGDAEVAGPLLYSYNLLRIAFLEKELKNSENEMIAWQDFEKYTNAYVENRADKNSKRAMDLLKKSFSENSIELADYISYRKSQLDSK